MLVGLCGAIALAAVSTAAHAIKLVPNSGDDPATAGVRTYTYAEETLLKDEVTEVDDVTYYNISRDHFVAGPADVQGESSVNYYVSFVLSGMVFAADVGNDALSATQPAAAVTLSPGTLVKHAGGLEGDPSVVFRLSSGSIHPKHVLRLTATFALSGDRVGGITRTVTNTALQNPVVPGLKPSATHSLPSAIKASPGLKENITAARGDPTGKARHEFMSFSITSNPDDTLYAIVGTVGLAFETHRHAQEDENIDALTDLIDEFGPGDDPNHTVALAGDFSFADKAGFDGNDDCSDVTEVRKSTEDGESLTDEVAPQSAEDFATAVQNVCIVVDGKTAITATDYYSVTTKYKAASMSAFPPTGGTRQLARILRDGYERGIPYLTTDSGYNQRFVIVNRWTDAEYMFHEMQSEDGVEVEAGSAATGTAPTGTTVLRAADIVSITGGTRASATLTVVAPEDKIDAAVQQVNLENRTVDTVYLD
jgi:hypothetical protein